ncbi:FAD-binding oxidoreductase, partial [Terriglobus sp. YAF25]
MLSAELLTAFLEIVGPRGLITAQNQLQTYECDGLTAFREAPSAVLLPETTGQVQAILRLCTRHK